MFRLRVYMQQRIYRTDALCSVRAKASRVAGDRAQPREAAMSVKPSFRRSTILAVIGTVIASLALLGSASAQARTSVQHSARLDARATHPRGLVYLRGDPYQNVWVSTVTGSRLHQVTFAKEGVTLPRWGPFGKYILYAVGGEDLDKQLWLIGADGRHKKLLRTLNSTREILDLAWAPRAGRIAVVMGTEDSDDPHDIFVYTRRTHTLTPLHVDTTYGLDVGSLDWSHDGRRLVLSARVPSVMGGPFNSSDLYTVAPDGDDLQQLTNTPDAEEANPRWSPDDSRLLFSSDGFALHAHCLVNAAADGTDQTPVPGVCSRLANWSANGRWIVFALEGQDSVSRIWTSALDGTARKFMHRGFEASFRPTG
jgi:Tol biopolymer transport system component